MRVDHCHFQSPRLCLSSLKFCLDAKGIISVSAMKCIELDGHFIQTVFLNIYPSESNTYARHGLI